MLSSAVPLLLSVLLASRPYERTSAARYFMRRATAPPLLAAMLGIVFRFLQFADVSGGVAQRAQGLAIVHDRIKKLLIPGHLEQSQR
jgi:hypothetical protein